MLLVLPIGALLAMMLFGLDERLASPKRKPGAGRTFCEVDGSGCSDPDGKCWLGAAIRPVAIRPIKAQLIPVPIKAQLIPVGGPGWGVAANEAGPASGGTTVICGYVVEK